ncbi:MAG TPA: ATP-binding protein [Thermoleophilaceae bacterium]|nr:ATP-binding protein [Thermoleophilaceae bacterium]
MSALDESPAAGGRYRVLIDALPVGVYQTDRNGSCVLVNQRWRELSGLSAAEAAGYGWASAIHPADRERVVARWRSALEMRGEFSDVEYRNLRPDGRVLWVASSAAALRDARGFITGFLVTCIDVTERRRTEQALRESRSIAEARLRASNADLERLAHVASQDLREPLGVVIGFLELLERRYPDRLGEDGMQFVTAALSGARRMRKLTRGLIELSRLAGAEPRYEMVDCAVIAAEVVRDLGAAIDESGASVTVGELPVVRADREQLARVLKNLIANAIKFRAAEPPRVSVEGRELSPGSWEISVADNGLGVDPRHAERVFEMFGRLHSSEAYAGTGVGLAVCRHIVERHGGVLRVEPVATGGSRFVFTLVAQPESRD